MSEENRKQMTISIWTEIILKAFYFQTVDNFKSLTKQMTEIIGQESADQVITLTYHLARRQREFV